MNETNNCPACEQPLLDCSTIRSTLEPPEHPEMHLACWLSVQLFEPPAGGWTKEAFREFRIADLERARAKRGGK